MDTPSVSTTFPVKFDCEKVLKTVKNKMKNRVYFENTMFESTFGLLYFSNVRDNGIIAVAFLENRKRIFKAQTTP
jgi:hypothetical protein